MGRRSYRRNAPGRQPDPHAVPFGSWHSGRGPVFQRTGFSLERSRSTAHLVVPFAYGLTFLLPTQLGFSCWFFMLFSRLELVVAAMWGTPR